MSSSTQTSAQNQNHLLNLKVLRLSKASFSCSSNTNTNANHNRATRSTSSKINASTADHLPISDILELPPAFGNIYLGEKFTSYLSINNDSQTPVNDVAFKAELQTTSQRFTLIDTIGATPTSSLEALNPQQQSQVSLLPRQSVEFLFDHEIKELGIHILVCSAHYTPAPAAPTTTTTASRQSTDQQTRKFFRKFFKFQVLNPLSVKTKVNNLASGKICLEIQVQNLATVPLCLDTVQFDANQVFTSKDLNNHKDFESKVISPQNVRQYLFVLSPILDNDLVCKTTPNLGRLDINWKSTLGQSGHLQTSQLTRKVPSVSPFELVVLDKPTHVFVERPLTLNLRLKNTTLSDPQRITIKTHPEQMPHLHVTGCSNIELGVVEGQGFRDFQMSFMPLVPGVHPIVGVDVDEKISGMSVPVDGLALINVLAPGA